MAAKWVYWLEEIGKEHSQVAGRKCANLGEMLRIGLVVPPGFALSTDAYLDFINQTEAADQIKEAVRNFNIQTSAPGQYADLSSKIRQIIISKEMPDEMASTIIESYRGLCRKCGVDGLAVSIRSAGPTSRPGQYDTYLNIAGESEVLNHIKKVWASTFNSRSLSFRNQKALPLESDPIGVAVIKMVCARSAGVAFTADPNTGDPSRITIEANWGVGESVVNGMATPDIFIVEKRSLEIQHKSLGVKSRCIITAVTGTTEIETPADKQSAYCLSDEEVKNIAQMACRLEEHFGTPQDVEWAIDQRENQATTLFLLQARPEIIAQNKTTVNRIVDLMINRFSKGTK